MNSVIVQYEMEQRRSKRHTSRKCETCNGDGEISEMIDDELYVETCTDCKGEGHITREIEHPRIND